MDGGGGLGTGTEFYFLIWDDLVISGSGGNPTHSVLGPGGILVAQWLGNRYSKERLQYLSIRSGVVAGLFVRLSWTESPALLLIVLKQPYVPLGYIQR